MRLHDRYGLTRLINAAGTYTPLGVSRSSPKVGEAAAEALADFFVMGELQDKASAAISRWTGAEAATVTHCAAAGITLAVAASMAGEALENVAALPDAAGLPVRVVLPAGHAVDYGHPILQDVRLAGATPILVGTAEACGIDQLADALAKEGTACLLLVSSRLVPGAPLYLERAVAAAHEAGVPAIIDGAAQDRRIPALLATGADLVIVSGHKYLASPTAGLVIGRRAMVEAVRAHGHGIGRAMKPTKEAILGLLAAIEARQAEDPEAWRVAQAAKVSRCLAGLDGLAGVRAAPVADFAGMPFSRVEIVIDPGATGLDAATLVARLKSGDPSIRVMEHALARGRFVLELVPLSDQEIDLATERIGEELRRSSRRRSDAGTSP